MSGPIAGSPWTGLIARYLAEHPDSTASAIADELGLPVHRVNAVLDHLHANGQAIIHIPGDGTARTFRHARAHDRVHPPLDPLASSHDRVLDPLEVVALTINVRDAIANIPGVAVEQAFVTGEGSAGWFARSARARVLVTISWVDTPNERGANT